MRLLTLFNFFCVTAVKVRHGRVSLDAARCCLVCPGEAVEETRGAVWYGRAWSCGYGVAGYGLFRCGLERRSRRDRVSSASPGDVG
jgi:hypothetical protein